MPLCSSLCLNSSNQVPVGRASCTRSHQVTEPDLLNRWQVWFMQAEGSNICHELWDKQRALIVEFTLRRVSSNMSNVSAKTEFHQVLLPIFTFLDDGRLAH